MKPNREKEILDCLRPGLRGNPIERVHDMRAERSGHDAATFAIDMGGKRVFLFVRNDFGRDGGCPPLQVSRVIQLLESCKDGDTVELRLWEEPSIEPGPAGETRALRSTGA